MDPTGNNLSMREILKMQRYANMVKNNADAFEKAKEVLTKEDA